MKVLSPDFKLVSFSVNFIYPFPLILLPSLPFPLHLSYIHHKTIGLIKSNRKLQTRLMVSPVIQPTGWWGRALSWQCQQYGAGNILTHPQSCIYHSMWSKSNGQKQPALLWLVLPKRPCLQILLQPTDSGGWIQGSPLETPQAKTIPVLERWALGLCLQLSRGVNSPIPQDQRSVNQLFTACLV